MPDDVELDVRSVPKPERHALIFAAYDDLEVGRALVLVNDHEPRHLREEFDRELAGGFAWESLGAAEDGSHRVRIVKAARTALPRVVADTGAVLGGLGPGQGGSVWQLNPTARDLDSNIIALPPGDAIASHDGPELDVLVLVLAGDGTLVTEQGEIPLTPGTLVWLPRRSRRRFDAGAQGLSYFTVHRRKPSLGIMQAPARS